MKKQAFNPYLPSWEYIPDGEPYVFGDRVYVFGSHDYYNGPVFCPGDYMGYSAPVDDLGNWRCEGVIYRKEDDPLNKDGKMCLYAPDVTVGSDGRYYLYYVLDHVSVVSVAVCDTPAGKYEFYGYVHYEDGTLLGEKEGDEPQFDPGVLTEGEVTYLYTGFCGRGDKSRTGTQCTVLGKDMLTIVENPVIVAPGCEYGEGTGFEGHTFFEAPSIRRINDTYYLIYSSTWMHELCYATSKDPRGKFTYGGVIVSNTDVGIDSYKDKERIMAYGANNHGSIVKINDEWYIFYHRHTNASWYNRQGCAEKIVVREDGSIPQVMITSCGLNRGPLVGKGTYPAYIACHIYVEDKPSLFVEEGQPRVMQDGRDGDENQGYIGHVCHNTVIGFKSFDCKDVKTIGLELRGYMGGDFEIIDGLDGKVIGTVKDVPNCNVWEHFETEVSLEDGVHDIYVAYRGYGTAAIGAIEFR